MALSSLPPFIQLLLNRRFSRIFLLICPLLLFLLAAALLSSPSLRDNGVGRGILPWLGSGKSTDTEFYPFETTSQFFPVSQNIEGKTTKELCDSFPSYITHRIQPVLKMGYGEKRAKIEAQLDSVSACFSDEELLIFSDLNETVRDRNVIDILADLPASYAVDNPHFQNYVAMQELRRNGTLNAEMIAAAGISGWDLDKFKFLPMVERAWAMRPGRDWYVFYETDTYIVWDNMFRFLSTLDPSTPQYIGSPSPGRHDTTRRKPLKTWFANGGPGFVLSRTAIERLLFRKASPTSGQYLDPPLGVKWLDLLRRDCCGDSVMGWTLWNVSVPLGGYWPMFNPHPLHGVPYSDLYWCQPVITLHKTRPEDMLDLWRWEHGRRQKETPLLYQDLYEFRHPGTPALRDNWDNGEWARFQTPRVDSSEACAKACEANGQCVQWLWRGLDIKECLLMRQIRLGVPREPEIVPEPEPDPEKEGEGKEGGVPKKDRPKPKERRIDFTSGWITQRIDKWREEKKCQAIQWVGPSITRIY